MNKLIKGFIQLSFILCLISNVVMVNAVTAKELTASQLPVLKQDKIHEVVTKRVTNYLTQSHYRNFALDGAFSAKIFDSYFKLLDGNKSLFIQENIDSFKDRQNKLSEELLSGDLKTAYDIYNLLLQKKFKRYQYALSLLQKPMDFSGKDEINFKRDDMAWPTSENALDAYWIKRVKFDELNLLLSGKTEKQIREVLTKRYTRVLKTLTQTNIEDAFQVFMNAFAREIDPHTSYLAPRKKRDFDSEMSLSFEGIGATLSQEDDYTILMSFVTGGPAEKSKQLLVGDKIIGVGQQNAEIEDVVGWRLEDIVDKIRGPKGTIVKLEILPAGNNSKPKVVEIKRDKIRYEDREAKLKLMNNERGKIGVLEIPSFYIGLTEKVTKLLKQANDEHLKGIVVDLRNDGGGSLSEVVALTGLFVAKGPVVQVRDNLQQVIIYDNQNKTVAYNGPLVVLVNRYSASASEIFSAAMQDYGRALIVGETTFGKGTVQTSRNISYPIDAKIHQDWPELGGIQYTVQKFYRINGGSTQIKGVSPDIDINDVAYIDDTGERFLDNAMPWDKVESAQYNLVANFKPILPWLNNRHVERVAKNKEFLYIDQDVEKYNQEKDQIYMVSLNKKLREIKQKESDERQLKRMNARLSQAGLKNIHKIEDVPKNFKMPDAYLDESVEIALDLSDNYSKVKSDVLNNAFVQPNNRE